MVNDRHDHETRSTQGPKAQEGPFPGAWAVIVLVGLLVILAVGLYVLAF